MNKTMKLRYRAVLSLVLSAVLFCMPAFAFCINGNNAIGVRAESSGGSAAKKETEGHAGKETLGRVMEDEAVSGGSITEPACTCGEKCGAGHYDKGCAVCAADYKNCTYKEPNVTLSISQPEGWHNEKAAVTFGALDVADTGNFRIAKMQAKIGQNGGWTDVTEDRRLEISENCTVYVKVTDQKGNTYEKNRAVRCFDSTKPTLNAAVSDGLLSIQVHDTDSGAKAVYVNGYEFTEFTNGTLNIRLQQFDAGYEYFTVSAMDNAGNMSEVYKTKNPYYKAPADDSDEDPAAQLPVNAEPSKPRSATGTVTEHTKTDSAGNAVWQAQKGQTTAGGSPKAADKEESGVQENTQSGKEFYTVQTASDKVFYLIVDREGEEETVYFLTEVTENDLLNTTSGNSETLPKNSAALGSAVPSGGSALPNNNSTFLKEANQTEECTGEAQSAEKDKDKKMAAAKKETPAASYILMGILAIAFIGGAYYFKVVRRKKDFAEYEDEEEDEDGEEYENEDDEPEDSFFNEDAGD